jgi:hypothetical protein
MSEERRTESTEFLKTQAVEYSTGRSSKDAINSEKNKFLKGVLKGPVRKKPAAAASSSSSASKLEKPMVAKVKQVKADGEENSEKEAEEKEDPHDDEDAEEEDEEEESEQESERDDEDESKHGVPSTGPPECALSDGPPEGWEASLLQLRQMSTPRVTDFFY